MNVVLITAAGSSQRMKQDIPKQFLNVKDRPVIVYTLEAFQKHPNIDAIAVVCLSGWEGILRAYAAQFNITKLKWIFPGGATGHESRKNGVMGLRAECPGDTMVLVHDGNRPFVSQEIISDSISCCMQHKSAVAAIPCQEAMLLTDNQENAREQIPRSKLARTQTPHAFYLDKLVWAHEEAEKRGITDTVATCDLMLNLGEEVYFSAGSEKNLKLTTTDDIEIFKALLSVQKDDWLK